jgi:hypothetical protein
MVQGFSTWRESTTTSPSGKHLGMYKALTNAHIHQILSDNDKLQLEKNKEHTIYATKILQLQHLIINTTIKHEHPLERWKVVHNPLIGKNTGQSSYRKTQSNTHF